MRAVGPAVSRWAHSRSAVTEWRARKRVDLPDGSKRDIVAYGPTRDGAAAGFYRKLKGLVRETTPRPETIGVTALFAEFLQHKPSIKGVKDKTIHGDGVTFKVHIAPALGDHAVTDVTLAEVQHLQHGLVTQKKYHTAELVTILLKSFFIPRRPRQPRAFAASRSHESLPTPSNCI